MRRKTIGPYELIEEFSAGRMARLYSARRRDPSTGLIQVVALKVINADLATDEAERMRFLAEIETNLLLEHPYVVPTYAYGVDAGITWYAMSLVPGLTFEMIKSRVAKGGEPEGLALYLDIVTHAAAQVCEGLAAAHALEDVDGRRIGLVHRDISPSNLLLGEDGITRVLDFGIAGRARAILETATQELLGTAYYVAPERIVNAKVKDPRSDIWSLGVVLWEMVTFEPLFGGSSLVQIMNKIQEQAIPDIREYRPDAPAALAEIIAKALRRGERKRFQSATEMGRALRVYLRGERGLVTSADAASWLRTIGQEEIARARRMIRVGRRG